jgi:hypothetical protein
MRLFFHSICRHIMRHYESDEDRVYKHAWLKTCLKCTKTNLFSSHMFECLGTCIVGTLFRFKSQDVRSMRNDFLKYYRLAECHVFIHRDCWQSAESSSRKSVVTAAPTMFAPRPRPTVSAEPAEQSATATAQEPRSCRPFGTREVDANTSCQPFDRGEPLTTSGRVQDLSDRCHGAEPIFSIILSKIRKTKQLRYVFIRVRYKDADEICHKIWPLFDENVVTVRKGKMLKSLKSPDGSDSGRSVKN